MNEKDFSVESLVKHIQSLYINKICGITPKHYWTYKERFESFCSAFVGGPLPVEFASATLYQSSQ